ncbi:hypothetical protein SAMN04488580_10987 [Mycobacterium sp. 283mftsu]|nr:hypothetical protein SAMN04488580_10987 [Mycobacterium sp. 283mftsu]
MRHGPPVGDYWVYPAWRSAAARTGHNEFEFGLTERRVHQVASDSWFGPMKEQIVNNGKVEVTHHEMTRLDIHTAMPSADFRARFERAAPVFDDDVV